MNAQAADLSPPAPTPPPSAGSGLFEGIVQQAAEAIIFADRQGVIQIWNPAAEALFGFSAEQALGASLDLIIPERFRPAHWRGYHEAIARGHPLHGGQVRITRAVHKDARKLYVEMSFGIIRDADGSVLGSLAVARDGAERRSVEAALRARIESLEGPAA